MKFETAFDIEDTIWFMEKDKPTEAIVSSISIHHSGGGACNHIKYSATNAKDPKTWLDHQHLHEGMNKLFKTKAELLASL
jgi:hypothetical protein